MIAAHIEPILIVTGAITAIALIQFIAPVQFLRMIFGETLTDVIGLALARHWGLLIFCVGVLLIRHFTLRFGTPPWFSRRPRKLLWARACWVHPCVGMPLQQRARIPA